MFNWYLNNDSLGITRESMVNSATALNDTLTKSDSNSKLEFETLNLFVWSLKKQFE